MMRMIGEQEAGSLAGVYGEIRRLLGLGMVPNIFKAMAAVNADVLLTNWTAFRCTLLEGELSRSLKEMIGLVVSLRNGCGYSTVFHSRRLACLKVPEPVVQSLVATGDAPDLPPRTRVVLQFARTCGGDFDRTPTDSLEAAGLSEEEIHEVVDTMLIVSAINRFAREVGVPADLPAPGEGAITA